MNKAITLAAGVTAWAGVALVAALIVFNIGAKNQVLMFLPILAVVVIAWAIGEVVTNRVFGGREEGRARWRSLSKHSAGTTYVTRGSSGPSSAPRG